MARGLSALQKAILQLAIRNSGACSNNCRLSNRDLLLEYYGFEPCCEIEGKRNGAHIFDRKVIGIKRYRSASVAVVKAFDRLVKRGFARRELNYGILLTEAGIKVAKTMASKRCKH